MSAVQLWRYSIPSERGEGWAVFVLGSDGYFSACSDWGNYAFFWTSTGCEDFREFLLSADRDQDYFVSKLSPVRRYSEELTKKSVKCAVLRARRTGEISKHEAQEEWDFIGYSDFGSEYGFQDWVHGTKLDSPWEYGRNEYDRQTVQFVRRCMARLIPLLKADLEDGI